MITMSLIIYCQRKELGIIVFHQKRFSSDSLKYKAETEPGHVLNLEQRGATPPRLGTTEVDPLS